MFWYLGKAKSSSPQFYRQKDTKRSHKEIVRKQHYQTAKKPNAYTHEELFFSPPVSAISPE